MGTARPRAVRCALWRSLIALGLGAAARAQTSDPRAVQPERPTVATHAFSVSPGYLEIETGIEHDRFGRGVTARLIPTVLKIGLASRAQLNVGIPVVRAPGGVPGIGDMSLGVKYRFTDDAPVLGAVALLPSLKVPTGNFDLDRGTNTTDLSLLAISSRKVGVVDVDLNAGYTRRSGDGTKAPITATFWTVSIGGPLSRTVGWVVEHFGYPGTSGAAGQAPTVAMLAGPTWTPRRWLALDAGVIVPVSGPQPHAIYAGAVYNVGRF